ncbi:outer membrane protein [Thalassobius sp. Cn5-15]|uniref:outer membrane protein n=1 Tax=Thalassobius sp. Cn5-15 TaxID=2917763 RepID=UPI001EF31409|nr:outer membrane beta-barrel protein [Thalassobius sp. Cn5-15]MCG7494952.1 porin family protein [Thalassobius sp. Cn5-15]
MPAKLLTTTALAGLMAASVATTAAAEIELSFYGGYQTSPHSRIEGTLPGGGGSFSELIGWEGDSFAAPPYYGGRITYWREDNTGWGVELTHAKVYGADETALFDRLEFSDGHNILTVNYSKRWPGLWNQFTPYVNAGLGIAVPHVDARATGSTERTFGYQYSGPAARLTAGASYALNENWDLFSEYQFTWSDNNVDLDGGGDLETRIITNSINVGVSYSF